MFRLGNDGICINASCSARRDRSAPPKAKGSANKNLCRFFVEFGLRRNNPELKSFLNQGPPSRSTQKRVAGFVEHGSAKHERFPNVPRSRQHSERNRALRCNYARWITGINITLETLGNRLRGTTLLLNQHALFSDGEDRNLLVAQPSRAHPCAQLVRACARRVVRVDVRVEMDRNHLARAE